MTVVAPDKPTDVPPTLAECGIDVAARLTTHMRATLQAKATIGNPLTKASAFYGDALHGGDVCDFIQRSARSHGFGCRIGAELGFPPSVSLWCLKGCNV